MRYDVIAWVVLVVLVLPAWGVAADVAPPAKTGQTVKYANGDDGDLRRGVSVSGSRFADNGDGTITDGLTGLIWLKEVNAWQGSWPDALTFCNTLHSGQYGLSDGSVAGQWRLPTVKELETLIDSSAYSPAFHAGSPFTFSLYSYNYCWTSTTDSWNTTSAWTVNLAYGSISSWPKAAGYVFFAVAVRGGQ